MAPSESGTRPAFRALTQRLVRTPSALRPPLPTPVRFVIMSSDSAPSSLSGTPLRVRVRLPSPTGPVVPGLPGIVCLGLPAREGFPPLVLVYDEGEHNSGASATNAMGTLLDWLAKAWGTWLPVAEALVVEHDSLGYFDHVLVRHGPGGVDIGWAPLRCPPHPARSEAAWRALGGPGAVQLLAEVQLAPR